MSQKPAIPKGTRDFLPTEVAKRNYMFATIKEVFRRYGYAPIETPSFELSSTLLGKYGDEGDRLIFRILNSGEKMKKADLEALAQENLPRFANSVAEKALRYDLTVPFARFVVQHQNDLTFPFKRYQIQPVWRADRPQKGRFQEFYQCDVDILGDRSLWQEVEMLTLYDQAFSDLGIKGVTLKINHRKILAAMATLLQAGDRLSAFTVAMDKMDKIGREGVLEELKNNDFTSIIFYDLAERFSNPEFVDPNDLPSKLFFFSYLDTRFNLWNYFFYLGILGVLLSYLLKKTNIEQIFSKLKSPIILVSICWTTPLILFQSFANLQHHWYLAPALPFIAILTYDIIFLLKKQFPFFKYIFFGTLVFTLFRQINMFNSFDEKSKIIETNQTNLAEAKRVINLIPHPSQSLILELYHCNPNQFFKNNISKFNFEIEKSDLIILRKEDQKLLPPTLFLEYIPISRENEFCILRKK